MTRVDYDIAVVGAGIVGLATAWALAEQMPGVDICVLEKEESVGFHQTGHNSGVLHTGLYYSPGSLKARLCVQGRRLMSEFCEEQDIPLRRCGKVVVATRAGELVRLEDLHRRGKANGLQGLCRVGQAQLGEIEPHVDGLAGLLVPEAAVVDFRAVALRLAERLEADVRLVSQLESISPSKSGEKVEVSAGGRLLTARLVVNCAGLHSDRVARLAGANPQVRILPFRGEYYRLSPRAAGLVKALIYPVPNPAFPFLGVHFTRRVDDTVEAGPNAVLALGREFYRGTRPSVRDISEVLAFRGFWRLGTRYWRQGMTEVLDSLSRRRYARRARDLLPELRSEDLAAGGAGVRAQAVTPHGRLVDDFLIQHSPGCVHVLNAPSPAASASLAIGRHVAGIVKKRLENGRQCLE